MSVSILGYEGTKIIHKINTKVITDPIFLRYTEHLLIDIDCYQLHLMISAHVSMFQCLDFHYLLSSCCNSRAKLSVLRLNMVPRLYGVEYVTDWRLIPLDEVVSKLLMFHGYE